MIYITTHLNNYFTYKQQLDKRYYTILNVNKIAEQNNNLIYQLHPYINEFCAQYYIYQNLDEVKDDWIAFCHYKRILPIDIIDHNILKNKKIQIFYFKQIHENNDIDIDYTNIEYPTIYLWINEVPIYFTKIKNNEIIKKTAQLLYNIIVGYLQSQSIIDINKIKYLTQFKNVKTYITREMYCCNKANFSIIIQVIRNFLFYLFNKYNISSVHDYTNFIKNIFDINYNKNNSYMFRCIGYCVEYLIGLCIMYIGYDHNAFVSLNNSDIISNIPIDEQKINLIKTVINNLY